MRLIKAVAVFAMMSFITTAVLAQGDSGCVSEKCHSDIGAKKWVHGPVGSQICIVCHNQVEGEEHEFFLAAEKDELCWLCHETSRDMMLQEHLHTPVANGNCNGCHDPHETDFRFSLKGDAADLCFVCHNQPDFTKDFVHGPVGVGDCNACHNPHASPHEDQLLSSKEEICFLCHKEQVGMLEKRHVHSPVNEDCSNCHNPHSSSAQFLLPDDSPGLCIGCHGDFAKYETMAKQHRPVADGNCAQCHEPHSSEHPKLFPVAQDQLCFSCHPELQEYVAGSEHLHGPIREGDCNACHDPHGSGFHRILRAYFPEEFYAPYADENYAICFMCHNQQIALDATTTTLTGFRDGDQNLHHLHVNKDVKGRTCRACHQVHASSQPKHIRTSVPFGKIKWELPVTFTQYEVGGNCIVGCHAPKDYKRK